ncbi:disabled homolog 2-like [Labrus mixtus]|uniref:disabled homolog 2-like n=1 Tax=Labrus mixtus TaxID=508554 RepID=UPI0029C04199|nr:disabled homolog 2-like [Labrus mixtus]
MMETEQTAGSCPDPSQTAVRTWVSSSTRGPPSEAISRFHGDGVRYKAKLIGTDPVLDAQGEKMCWDSMMKLKGFEAAGRKQGKHKQRVWLKVSSGGLKIVDERTGAVLYDHDRTRISSLTKDESDPRALAYVYQHQDSYNLFYIKMANLADPVLTDIKEVCQGIHRLIPQEPAEPQAQNNALLLLSDSSTPPAQVPSLEDVFSPRPETSSAQSNQKSPSNELLEVFSVKMQDPLVPPQTSCVGQPGE